MALVASGRRTAARRKPLQQSEELGWQRVNPLGGAFGSNAMVELLLFVAGALISAMISRHYYSRSASEVPSWARPLIEKLPDLRPSDEELLRLFQESLQSGRVTPDPLLGHVACPKCNALATEFKRSGFFDDQTSRGVVVTECPSCGWSESAET